MDKNLIPCQIFRHAPKDLYAWGDSHAGHLAAGLGRRARLFEMPQAVFAAFRRLPALGPVVTRLTLSLQVDDSATRCLLDWVPQVSPEAGLVATARAFREG